MKKILIPTDFSVASLRLVEYAILNNPNTPLNIVLVAGYRLPDTRWALTHFNKSEEVNKQLTDSFVIAKRSLRLEHKKSIQAMSFELFTGNNSCAFQNFLEQSGADDAIIPKAKSLYCKNRKWFDTTRFLKKNVNNVTEVPVERDEELSQQRYSLINLLNL
ncbi:universal stress protein [Allomuricauda sp. F6463D]|uniref:universal stress protein n=1 Tax=Allomuricauda sp. F6463D TaxID=2926409 RepID=UPI001FF14E41|nr:universal stress protein [Muricauda sp. F6463D]MCK0161302.1 universal stress protein [Muricauda sp. F6463D]